jgi:predicted AlkP superfamily phosphohydrolase/phosphomutase
VIERFMGLLDPDDGRPVTDHVLRREEVMSGPEAAGAPDLFPVCRAYSYELSDGLYSTAAVTDYRTLPRGFHHMDGIFGIAGPGVPSASEARAEIYDIAPTALYLAGLRVPEGLDGKVLTAHIPPEMLAARPVETAAMELPLAGEGAQASPYSEEEEARIEESLRNLGYL